MSAIGGDRGSVYPPVQNGNEKRPGLITKADFLRIMTTAERAKLAALEVPVLRLSYDASTDLLNGAAIAAATWTNVFADQSFTIASVASRFLVEVRIHVAVTAVALGSIALRALLDGTTPVMLAGNMVNAGAFAGVSGATFQGAGFGAGSHSIRVQLYCSTAATAYCRANSQPNFEFAAVRVLELTP
jgi:hypothetical protein